jgi:hypothetical protein
MLVFGMFPRLAFADSLEVDSNIEVVFESDVVDPNPEKTQKPETSAAGEAELSLAVDQNPIATVTVLAAAPDVDTSPWKGLLEQSLVKLAAYQYSGLAAPGYQYEWQMLGLARGGFMNDATKTLYLENLAQNLELLLGIGGDGTLDSSKYTENSRVVLALTSLGIDATDFAGYDLVAPLSDFNAVSKQGINGPAFALIAMNSGNYAVPQETKDRYINFLLERQKSNGGFNFPGINGTDPDLTAMVLQALAPYYHRGNATLDAAVESALSALSNIQKESGGFSSWGEENSESTGQVVVALNELGIPLTDERFVKNGVTLFDALSSYLVDTGSGTAGFRHVPAGPVNGMATEQGVYAFVSLLRSLNNQPSIYAMSDVSLAKYERAEDSGADTGGNTENDNNGENGGESNRSDTANQGNTNLTSAAIRGVSTFYAASRANQASSNTPETSSPSSTVSAPTTKADITNTSPTRISDTPAPQSGRETAGSSAGSELPIKTGIGIAAGILAILLAAILFAKRRNDVAGMTVAEQEG